MLWDSFGSEQHMKTRRTWLDDITLTCRIIILKLSFFLKRRSTGSPFTFCGSSCLHRNFSLSLPKIRVYLSINTSFHPEAWKNLSLLLSSFQSRTQSRDSLCRRAKVRNVGLRIFYGGWFTFSTLWLIIPWKWYENNINGHWYHFVKPDKLSIL